MIEIIPQGSCFAVLHESLSRSPAKGRDRLRAIPRHGLIVAAGPILDPLHNLNHLANARLRFWCLRALRLVESLPVDPDGLRQLALGHAQSLSHPLGGQTTLGIIERPKLELIVRESRTLVPISSGLALRAGFAGDLR